MGADFIDRLREITARIPKQREQIQTEEATKTAFVMPFINALGYNVFDPTEVVPEFTADVADKKGEKVDYAITVDGKPVMLFECKWCGANLDQVDASQLIRYFSATDVRIGVLTNGIAYRFFTDLDKPNIMDKKPFLELDMLNLQEPLVAELKKLTKSSFDLDQMLTAASDLKFTKEIKRLLVEQMDQPSEGFVRFLGYQVYQGNMTQRVVEQFTGITRRAFIQFVNEQINERLKSALDRETQLTTTEKAATQEGVEEESPGDRIVTTDEEIEAFYMVKAILREVVDPARVFARDQISYFNVLLDDTNRQPICRFYFSEKGKALALIDAEKREERITIADLNEIYKYADRIKGAVGYYEAK